MAEFNAKYVAELLFSKFWLLVDTGSSCPEESFTKKELELILLYVKHPEDRKDTYLTAVETALADGSYKV